MPGNHFIHPVTAGDVGCGKRPGSFGGAGVSIFKKFIDPGVPALHS